MQGEAERRYGQDAEHKTLEIALIESASDESGNPMDWYAKANLHVMAVIADQYGQASMSSVALFSRDHTPSESVDVLRAAIESLPRGAE
jgi:hypothetical protein